MVKWFLKAGENNLMQDITLSISNIKEYNQLFNAVKSDIIEILCKNYYLNVLFFVINIHNLTIFFMFPF